MTPFERRDLVTLLGQIAAIGSLVLAGYCVEYTGTMPPKTAMGIGAVLGVLVCMTFDILREYRDGERRR